MKGFIGNIEAEIEHNKVFLRVLCGNYDLQFAILSPPPPFSADDRRA